MKLHVAGLLDAGLCPDHRHPRHQRRPFVAVPTRTNRGSWSSISGSIRAPE
jgi:hypothetical protein